MAESNESVSKESSTAGETRGAPQGDEPSESVIGDNRENDPRSLLTAIYLAMAVGVGALATVFFILGPPEGTGVDRGVMRWVWLGTAALCTAGAAIVRGRALSVSDVRSVLPAAAVVWSLVEAQALLAAVGFFLTGDLPLLVVGLILFVFLMGRHRPASFLEGS